jgi:hypothetical protein
MMEMLGCKTVMSGNRMGTSVNKMERSESNWVMLGYKTETSVNSLVKLGYMRVTLENMKVM